MIRAKLALLIISLVGLAVVGCSGSGKDEGDKGLAMIKDGQHDAAIDYYDKLLRRVAR